MMRCGASLAMLLHLKAEEQSGLMPEELRDSTSFLVDVDPYNFEFSKVQPEEITTTIKGVLQEGAVKVHLFLDAENVVDFRSGKNFAAVPHPKNGQHDLFELVVDLRHLEIDADDIVSDTDLERKIFRHALRKYVPTL